jgi:hypothetical protein
MSVCSLGKFRLSGMRSNSHLWLKQGKERKKERGFDAPKK